ncbi:MAG: hypothetical protein DRN90_00840 [Thermoproteota archaeon]|nr:MAG: hypothetical protein DRN90_00840 [Candidatus Korarchaeota archaeon]
MRKKWSLSKKQLEITLQSLEQLPNPKPELEQYSTPPSLAAEILYMALLMGDIEERIVADLGCGTGTFALGASLMGAKEAIGIDIDPKAIVTSWRNADLLGLDNVRFYVADILEFNERVDVVFQNPPFGVQRRHADVPFLEKALSTSNVVYTIHKRGNEDFITDLAHKYGGRATNIIRGTIKIPKIFEFHKKKWKVVEVSIFRFVREVN